MDNGIDDIQSQIISYWNDRSLSFSRTRMAELSSPNAVAWSSLLAEMLPEKNGLYILDVGTGAGFLSIILAKLGHNVVGIDNADDMLAKASINAKLAKVKITTHLMNADKINFADNSFDVVISRNLTWTLPQVEKSYLEWLRVLKPDGWLLNFDSDYGKRTFTRTEDKANTHASITQEKIDFYNCIKSKLSISHRSRPQWDSEFLSTLGMSVSIMADIRPLVHIDSRFRYDDIPLFAIKAQK